MYSCMTNPAVNAPSLSWTDRTRETITIPVPTWVIRVGVVVVATVGSFLAGVGGNKSSSHCGEAPPPTVTGWQSGWASPFTFTARPLRWPKVDVHLSDKRPCRLFCTFIYSCTSWQGTPLNSFLPAAVFTTCKLPHLPFLGRALWCRLACCRRGRHQILLRLPNPKLNPKNACIIGTHL